MTIIELTPYDTGEVCEPKVWLDRGRENLGDPGWGKVDFDNEECSTVIAGLRVVPLPGGTVAIEFGANVDHVVIREVNGARVKISTPGADFDDLDTLDEKIRQAERAITQGSDVNEENETRLADLLASIFHWCDANGVDFQEASDLAENIKSYELADWGHDDEQRPGA
jgi:hypothetical protein